MVYRGLTVVRIQNPKHAKKTARNQLFTGARLLSLEIDTARYDQLFQSQNHVLLKRDVINVTMALLIGYFIQKLWCK